MLHVDTYNTAKASSGNILDKLIYAKNNLENQIRSLIETKRNLIRWTDKVKSTSVAKRVQSFIKIAKIKFINDVNTSEKSLERRVFESSWKHNFC